ncbi:heme A synthase, partial [Salmonella enterica subsp. enterica serovar Enteritidis]
VLAALLLVGTFVTAAGPHSGDADTPRLAAGVPAMAQLHADLLFAYLGLLVGLGFALRAVAAPAALQRRYMVLVAVVVAQGVLGGVQY